MPLQRLNWALQYAGARLLAGLIGVLSWDQARALGERLGLLASRLAPKRRRLSVENVKRAFPDYPDARAEAVALEAWKNLGRVGTEMVKALSYSREELLRHCVIENAEVLRRRLRPGEGALFHAGHFGSWEVANLGLAASGLPMTAIGRRIKNPYIDAWLGGLRSNHGATILSHKNPFFPSVKAIKQGRIVGILMDQSLPTGGVFLPFFGVPAATTTLTALLAIKLKCPIFPIKLWRKGSTVMVTIQEPVEVPAGSSEEELTARLTGIIESWVREDPANWFWLHNRWKRRPEPVPAEAHG